MAEPGKLKILAVMAARNSEELFRRADRLIMQKSDLAEIDYLILVPNASEKDPRNPWPNILEKYGKGREIAIRWDYDALFLLEDDILAPGNALDLLLRSGKEIICGIYRLRPTASAGKCPLAVLRFAPGERERGHRWPGSISFLEKDPTGLGVEPVDALAYGCTLIHRRVLVDHPFTVDLDYSQNLREAGIPMHVHWDVLCGHEDVGGKLVWV